MGKPGAFLDIDRVTHELRPVEERSHDFDPLYVELDDDARRAQASRCMMCGVAFCQMGASFGKARPSGCPLHNLIPEWNELVYRGRWDEAAERLSLTSPMPEFTSRVCPALCEAACNLGSVDGNMKLEKSVVERRVALMRELGIVFELGADVNDPKVAAKLDGFDAVVVAAGARAPRGLSAANIDAPGVVYAVDYLTASTISVLDGGEPAVNAHGLDVVVIGGGDTGNDCVGTAVRQGARSVRQFEFLPAAPDKRAAGNPWPQWPNVKKTDYGQQEAIAAMGGEMRAWGVDTLEVLLDKKGAAAGLRVVDLDWSAGKPERIAGSEHEVPAQLVLIACGFTGPERSVFEAVGVPVATAGRPLPVMVAEGSHLAARVDGVAADAAPVYVAGDARNGSSLVVSAMADALACAAEVAEALEL